MEPIRKVEEEEDLGDSIEEGDVEDLVEERNLVEAKGDRWGQPGQQYFRSR